MDMEDLVSITDVPPLRQSLIETMACPHSYKSSELDGLKGPSSIPAARGTEVHEVAAKYHRYCKQLCIKGDWAVFDKIAASVGPEAAEICAGIRDNYEVDWEHMVDAEYTFYLDRDFQPCAAADAAYSGTMDVLFINGTHGDIPDWKSNLRPFDAPTAQSDLYALAAFMLYPELEDVTFAFRFVRYNSCQRVAEYTRADVPGLMETMRHYRAKQLGIHAAPDDAEAIPSKQCLYCPLLNRSCPVPFIVNPYTASTQERMSLAVYLNYAQIDNNARLREYYEASGFPIQYTDGKGDLYEFSKKATEGFEYPLLPVVEKLLDYRHTNPEDIGWMDRLRIKSTELNQYTKAKKRVNLSQSIKDCSVPVTRVKTGLHKPEEEEEGNDD